jgi:hypothetical protein
MDRGPIAAPNRATRILYSENRANLYPLDFPQDFPRRLHAKVMKRYPGDESM